LLISSFFFLLFFFETHKVKNKPRESSSVHAHSSPLSSQFCICTEDVHYLLPLTEHTLHNLLLLKKESTKDPLADAAGAAGATVGAGDGLLALRHRVKLGGTHTRDAGKRAATITATHGLGSLGEVVHHKLATRNANRLELVAASLV